jgi:hypothetical protein
MSDFQTPTRNRSDSIGSFDFDANPDELGRTPPSAGWFNTPDYTPPGSPSEFPNNGTPDIMFEPRPRGLGRQTTPGRVNFRYNLDDSDDEEADIRNLRAALFTGDEDLTQGIAFEVHNKYKKDVNENKILDLLNTKDPTDYTNVPNIVEQIRPILTEMTGQKDQQKLTDILDKLDRATEIRNDPSTKNLLGKIVTFVKNQDTDFQRIFMEAVISDCATAYEDGAYNKANLSCPKGIVERFTLSLGNVAVQFDDGSKYNDIVKAFEKPVPEIDIPRLFERWSMRLDDLDTTTDAKEDFISFVQSDDKSLERSDIISALEQAPLYETYYIVVFKNKQLGGKMVKRKRTLKKRKAANKTKKRGKPIIRKRVNKTKRRRNTKKRK